MLHYLYNWCANRKDEKYNGCVLRDWAADGAHSIFYIKIKLSIKITLITHVQKSRVSVYLLITLQISLSERAKETIRASEIIIRNNNKSERERKQSNESRENSSLPSTLLFVLLLAPISVSLTPIVVSFALTRLARTNAAASVMSFLVPSRRRSKSCLSSPTSAASP